MVFKFLGSPSNILVSTSMALIYTEDYLNSQDIPNYVPFYFGDGLQDIVTKDREDEYYTFIKSDRDIKFNTLVFYNLSMNPVGYCLLNSTIDTALYHIDQIRFELNFLNSITDTEGYLNVDFTDYSGHDKSNQHPVLGDSKSYSKVNRFNTDAVKNSVISSDYQTSICSDGMTRYDGILMKTYGQLDNRTFKPVDYGSAFDYKISDEGYSMREVGDEFRESILNQDLLKVPEWEIRVYEDQGVTRMINTCITSAGSEHTDIKVADSDDNQFLDTVNNSRFLLFSDIVVMISPLNNTINIYDTDDVLTNGFGNDLKKEISDAKTFFLYNGFTKNLLTNKSCTYHRNSSGKIIKIFDEDLERLVERLNLSISISTAYRIWGYTDSVILYKDSKGTYIATEAPINKSKSYLFPFNVEMVEAISDRSFLVFGDGMWRLIRMKVNEDENGYDLKIYRIGNIGSFRKVELISTLPRIYNDKFLYPILFPVLGKVNAMYKVSTDSWRVVV